MTPVESAFQQYLAKFGKSYETKAEYLHRLEIFANNYQKINDHNSKNENEHGLTMGLNQFSDMSEKEFKKMLGYKKIHAENNAM